MSLELELQRCTEALSTLTEALKAFQMPTVATTPPKAAKAVADPKPAATPPAPVTAPEVIAPPEAATAPPSEVDYAAVAKAITDTFPVDRAKVVAALAKFGATRGPQLKPQDYAAFLAELT